MLAVMKKCSKGFDKAHSNLELYREKEKLVRVFCGGAKTLGLNPHI